MSLLKNYTVTKTIGSGTYGKVKLAVHNVTNLKVAIKILNRHQIRSEKLRHTVKREIKILRLFRHPHIIRLYDVIKSSSSIMLVTEYIPNGDMYNLLERKGKLQLHEARHYLQQIIAALDYLHKHDVAHRDIKPENLLMDGEMNIKVTDFGLSNLMGEGEFLQTSCGSPNYAAPEVISGMKYCGTEVDVWSTGVVLFALLAGYLPFDDSNISNLFKKIRAGEYSVPHHFPPDLKDLLCRMLNPDPLGRITIPQIKKHPWFKVEMPLYISLSGKSLGGEVSLSCIQQGYSFDKIDEEVLEQCLSLPEFQSSWQDREELVSNIKKRKGSNFYVTYQLMLDSKLKAGRNDIEKGSEIVPVFKQGLDATFSQEETVASDSGVRSYEEEFPTKPEHRENLGPQDWVFGLRTTKDSECLMCDLFQELKSNGLEWKIIGDFYFRVRRKNWDNSKLKFDIKIYGSEGNYVIDIRLVSGFYMKFLELCSSLIQQFNTLA